MGSTMTAAVARTFGQALAIEETPRPTAGPGQVLVEIAACDVCHTDLHAANGGWPIKPALPFIPGHEGAGAVVEAGEGVTVYKGLKVQDAKAGDWVVISGVGGLGRMAAQYAKAMGFKVAAVDIDDDKPALARTLGAELTVNTRTRDPGPVLQEAVGGACGVLATAVSPTAFPRRSAWSAGAERYRSTACRTAISRFRSSTPSCAASLFEGAIVGTRLDLQEALAFAADGRVRATVETQSLDAINTVFDRLRAGEIEGRS